MKPTNEVESKILDVFLPEADIQKVEIKAIPGQNDRMLRIRSLEEAIDDFDSSRDDDQSLNITYVIQVKKKQNPSKALTKNELPSLAPACIDGEGDTFFTQLVRETLQPAKDQAAHSPIPPPPPFHLQKDPMRLLDGNLDVSYLFENAKILFEAKEYHLARNIYLTVLRSKQNTAQATLGLARCFDAENNDKDALIHFEQSVAFDPNLDSLEALAHFYLKKGKNQEAAECFERTLRLPDLDQNQVILVLHKAAKAWRQTKQKDRCIPFLRKIIAIQPLHLGALIDLAEVLLSKNEPSQFDTIQKLLETVILQDSTSFEALALLGQLGLCIGKKQQALDYFVRSLEFNLDQPSIIFALVKTAYEIKTYSATERILSKYVAEVERNANLLYSLGGLQFHLGKIEDAKKTILETLAIDPAHTGATELKSILLKYSIH